MFVRTFAFVTIRRIVDYDNMPLLTKEAGFSGLNARTALRYISMFARIRASRAIGMLTGARRPAMPANPALLNKIKSDGIVCLTLAPDEIDQIRSVTNPGFAKLDERRASIPPEKRKFDDNVYWCTRSADAEAFATVENIFKRYGIMEAASAYLGRPAGVKHVNAQINDQDLAFWKRVFPDTQLQDPWGSYLHIDATYGMLKCAIYVHDIGPDGGPFCYIRGSQNAKIGWFEGMVRRTNDFSGFSVGARRAQEIHGAAGVPAQEGGFRRRPARQLPRRGAAARGTFRRDLELWQLRTVRRQRHASRRHGEQGRAPLPVHPACGTLRPRCARHSDCITINAPAVSAALLYRILR